MESYVVRIYRRGDAFSTGDAYTEIIGFVEDVESGDRLGFQRVEELCAIFVELLTQSRVRKE